MHIFPRFVPSVGRLRAGLIAQQETAGSNGGVASAVRGRCQHATAALDHIKRKVAKDATKVKIDGEQNFAGVKKVVAAAKADGLLLEKEFIDVIAVVDGAEGSGVWPLYETEHNHYAVYDNRTRTTEHDWGTVKFDNPSPGSAPRRTTAGKKLMCRVRLRRDGRHRVKLLCWDFLIVIVVR